MIFIHYVFLSYQQNKIRHPINQLKKITSPLMEISNLISQNSLQSILTIPDYGQLFYNIILETYQGRHRQSHYFDPFNCHKYQGKLYGWLINQWSLNMFSHQQLAKRTQKFPWYQKKGLGSMYSSYDRDKKPNRPDKETCPQHFQYMLNYLKSKQSQLPYIGKIIQVTKSKNSRQQNIIFIDQQKGLSIKPQGNDYLKYNIFFNSLAKKDQIKFFKESIIPIIALNNHQIDHNDVTFRNYIWSFLDGCFKLIDFDISYNYKQFFQGNPNISPYQPQIYLSSLQNSLNAKGGSLIYTYQQINQMLNKDSCQQFRLDNVGKKDTIMYGFMILRLIFDLKDDPRLDITQQIGKLVKRFQEGQLQQNSKLNHTLLDMFSSKYFQMAKFILQNMMVRSCRKRSTLKDLYEKWNKQVEKVELRPDSKITQANSNQDKSIKNISDSYSNQSLNPENMPSIPGSIIQSKNFSPQKLQSDVTDSKLFDSPQSQISKTNPTEKFYKFSQANIKRLKALQMNQKKTVEIQKIEQISISTTQGESPTTSDIKKQKLFQSPADENQKKDKLHELQKTSSDNQKKIDSKCSKCSKCSKNSELKNKQINKYIFSGMKKYNSTAD